MSQAFQRLERLLTFHPGEANNEIRSLFLEQQEELNKKINTPELQDFIKAVPLEAIHQKERWGLEHDSGKAPEDWFWTVGYLVGKALRAHIDQNFEKAKHHTITAAALLANWHRRILEQEKETT